MAIVTFERIVKCSVPFQGPITKDEAQIIASVAAVSSNVGDQFDADYFEEIYDVPVPEDVNLRCYGGAFKVNERSIDICGGFTESEVGSVKFSATQKCVFFANNTPYEAAVDMAAELAIEDKVEQSLSVEAPFAGCWVISAPEGIPNSVLSDIYAPEVPVGESCLLVRAIPKVADSA